MWRMPPTGDGVELPSMHFRHYHYDRPYHHGGASLVCTLYLPICMPACRYRAIDSSPTIYVVHSTEARQMKVKLVKAGNVAPHVTAPPLRPPIPSLRNRTWYGTRLCTVHRMTFPLVRSLPFPFKRKCGPRNSKKYRPVIPSLLTFSSVTHSSFYSTTTPSELFPHPSINNTRSGSQDQTTVAPRRILFPSISPQLPSLSSQMEEQSASRTSKKYVEFDQLATYTY
jgi:hypothetical protein